MHLMKATVVRFTASFLLVSALAAPAFALTGIVNSNDGPAQVRTQTSADSELLTNLAHGTQVEVISVTTDGWYEIALDAAVGFVSSDELFLGGPKSAVSAVSATAPTAIASAPAAAVTTAPPVVEQPVVEAPPVAEQAPAQPVAPAEQYARVAVSSLNVRAGAGTDYDKVGALRGGRVVEILGESNGWYKIDSGYISAEYVTIVDAAEAAASGKGQEIADYALGFVGYPYVYGGSSPKGFDCSGLVYYVCKQFDYSISRTASSQMDHGESVSMSELQPGDLVFFKKSGTGSSRASHVGIYIGNNQFVHASTAKVGVIISNMSDAYYTTGFVGGRRLF